MALFDPAALKTGVRVREVWGWALFDAANSGYSTVILTAVFNTYFVSVICGGADWATFLWTVVVAASNILCLILMPAFSRAADIRAEKKRWCFIATLCCIAATALLTFTGPGTVAIASLLVIVSNIGFSVGESMNSAFLPELAKPESLGRVSGWGWSLGYGGGLVTLALCLIVLQIAGAFDIPQTESVPAVSLVVAVVFAVTALPFFLWVKERSSAGAVTESFTATVLASFKEMRGTLELIPAYRDFAWLTCCGFLYQCGIATVIALAAVYASAVMGFTVTKTLIMVLAVNITAAVGAFCFGYVQDKLGHKRALALTLLLWVAMVATAAAAQGEALFWVSANLAGLAMGSSQSAGRAMVGLLAPEKRLAEFYGLWNMALWLSAAVGPLTYGAVSWMSGNNQRLAILVTGLFFVAGLLVLSRVNLARGTAQKSAVVSL